MSFTATDLAMIKLSYPPQEFSLLEQAMSHEPSLVNKVFKIANPADFNDTAAIDRIICSLFVYARDEYEFEGDLPLWAQHWFDSHWPNSPYREFHAISLFDSKSRYNGIELIYLH